MFNYLWIMLGGGLGSAARYWVADYSARRLGETAQRIGAGAFPLGTFVVNVSGCFLIGLLAGMSLGGKRLAENPVFRQVLVIGFCGGYTTFSSFSLQTLERMQANDWFWATVNVVGSVVACMAAVWLGLSLTQWLGRR